MKVLIARRLLRLATSALAVVSVSAPAFVLSPAALHAQSTGVIRGTVTSEGTNAPVEGVQVSVVGDARVARTDRTGLFRIGGVPAGARTVRVLRIGYAGQTRSVTVADRDSVTVDFVLRDAALSLDAVVVTGTAAEARKKEVGNAMATIDSRSLESAPVKDAQDVIGARAPGITVMGNSGQPGAGGTIRLRGSNSITQGNNPVIYVDGIRIYSSGGPITPSARQSAAAFNDIKADEIERIEIVKGAAATTLYGTEASGGVIQIFTKRGSAGAPQWTVAMGAGQNVMGHVGPASDQTGLGLNNCSGIQTDGTGLHFTDPTCPASGSWLRHGAVQRLDLEVKGGGENMTYFLSGNYNDNQGVVRTGYQKDGGFRANFSFTPAKNLVLGLNTSYNKKSIGWLGDGNLANGFTLNVMRGSSNNFKGGKGTDCANVPAGTTCITNGYILDTKVSNDADHFITGVSVGWSPIAALSNRFNLGFDYNISNNKSLLPFGFLNLASGSLNNSNWNHTKLSLDYAGSYQSTLPMKLASTLSWGGQLFDDRERFTGVTGRDLAGPGDPTLASFATVTLGTASEPRVVNAGVFLQEMVGWNDRLFLTAGVRVDGNSAFGSAFGLQTYPKVSAAYVVSEEKWWPSRWVSTLKLRAAVGESGKAPGAFDAVRTWDPVAGDEGKPGVSVAQRGNADLGPERTREFELGFDVSALGDRLALEVTGFQARTYDALIGVVYPPSEGFSRSQLRNVGTLENKGLEVQVNADLLRGAKIDWRARLSLTSLASNTIDVGGVPIATGLGSYVREGFPVPGVFGARITNPDAIADPIVAADQYLGPVYPTRLLGMGTTLTLWRDFTLDVLGEYQAGGHLTNFIGFQNESRNVWQPCYAVQAKLRAYNGADARKGTADDVTSALDGVTALDRGRCAIDGAVRNSDFWLANTDFFKLRSISLSWRIPPRFLRGAKAATFTVAGRNLFKSTKYDGVDPESNDASDAGTGLGRREYYQLPPFKTLLATLRLTF
jgi:TonB-dependent SusC/RagA subfamily outer membrane receptor